MAFLQWTLAQTEACGVWSYWIWIQQSSIWYAELLVRWDRLKLKMRLHWESITATREHILTSFDLWNEPSRLFKDEPLAEFWVLVFELDYERTSVSQSQTIWYTSRLITKGFCGKLLFFILKVPYLLPNFEDKKKGLRHRNLCSSRSSQ